MIQLRPQCFWKPLSLISSLTISDQCHLLDAEYRFDTSMYVDGSTGSIASIRYATGFPMVVLEWILQLSSKARQANCYFLWNGSN